jgi:hypothetical protein
MDRVRERQADDDNGMISTSASFAVVRAATVPAARTAEQLVQRPRGKAQDRRPQDGRDEQPQDESAARQSAPMSASPAICQWFSGTLPSIIIYYS